MTPQRTVVCDLDGVVYVGGRGVPGARDALERIVSLGHGLLFCTNNSVRTVDQVAEKIRRLTGFPARVGQVVSSAMAVTEAMTSDDSPAFVLGGEGLRQALADAGIEVTAEPVNAASVVIGLDLDLRYSRLRDAVLAVRAGARLLATNGDVTYPAEDGLWPGAGSILAAVEAGSETKAVVAGKPHAPMRALIKRRAQSPVVVVGDRPDTDLAMAHEEGWESILVLTGVTKPPGDVEPCPTAVATSLTEVPLILGDQ